MKEVLEKIQLRMYARFKEETNVKQKETGYGKAGCGEHESLYLPNRRRSRRRRSRYRLNPVIAGMMAGIVFFMFWLIGFISTAKTYEDEAVQETTVQTTNESAEQSPHSSEEIVISTAEPAERNHRRLEGIVGSTDLTGNKKPVKEKVEDPRISAEGPSEGYFYEISNFEKEYLVKLVYAESRGEPLEGKVAVAAVVLNRYTSNSSWFDNESIVTVIEQKYQFASVENISEADLAKVPECLEAVELALRGWDPTRKVFPEGALYFFAPSKVSEKEAKKREGIKILNIGAHSFHNEFAS